MVIIDLKIEKVYFIDLNEEIDEDIAKESMEINDSYTSGVKKNVFFMKDGNVRINVYNNNGQLVDTLLNTHLPRGDYSIQWNPRDISSGVYHIMLETGNTAKAIKTMFLK